MTTDDLIPEERNESEPFYQGSLEAASFLELAGFIYVRSCRCCGHWFLSTEFPLEVCVDLVGRTIKAYSLANDAAAFAQMIIPEYAGFRHHYITFFTENFAHAWGFAATHQRTYTVPYAHTPGHLDYAGYFPPF